ncbi:MAG: hypothetical protein GXO25_01750 [Euryarchaeota archaeon]|nr:hypothetical protein [Euryarchaeota archaeon]
MKLSDNRVKTMLCVAIAGFIFIPAVIFQIPMLIIIGAFFDWLPLPTGWMRFGGKVNRSMLIIHIVLTLTAYGFAVLFFFNPASPFRFAFLETWWAAVMAGVFMSF